MLKWASIHINQQGIGSQIEKLQTSESPAQQAKQHPHEDREDTLENPSDTIRSW